MKILICDYEDELKRDIEYEKKIFRDNIKDDNLEIEVYPYKNEDSLIEKIKDADILLTAFIKIDKKVLDAARNLKLISVNATGYGTIDAEYAKEKNIRVCNVYEYCTQEVAEHVLALILALSRGLKAYNKDVEINKRWSYLSDEKIVRLQGQTLSIFGLGRIGRAVAKRAQAFEINAIAVDPYVKQEDIYDLNVKLVSKEYALENSDIISNHMNETSENKYYFSSEEFRKMKKNPIFINAARGSAVDEKALVDALEQKIIRAAGLDVLKSEKPDLAGCELLNRDNVIVTPHTAFYSETALRELQRISCENIIYFINGELEKVFKFVN